MMKILLIRPKPHQETIGLQSVMICEPLELMQLAAVLKKNGHSVELLDMILEKKPLDYFVRLYNPDVVGITGYISHVGIIKDYSKKIKAISERIKIVVGGVHATVCPEDFQDEHIDRICEDANSFYDYLECQDKRPCPPWRDLPKKYKKQYYYLFAQNCALIKTSFGCPYDCNFCFCKEISPYSTRDMDEVIEELLQIKEKEVYIVDDNFLFNRERLILFAQKLKEKNIHKNFLVYGRADFIAHHEDVIEMLAETGLKAVIVGIEAANQEELNAYNKRTAMDDNIKAIAVLKKYSIECYATVILGIHWEKKNFENLYRFIKNNGLVFVNLQPFTPMPKTPYFDDYKDSLIIPYSQHEKWDMAHLVVKPTKISVRGYYYQMLKLYYKITITPQNILYMFQRYGVGTTLKLSLGATRITWQYIKKILRG